MEVKPTTSSQMTSLFYSLYNQVMNRNTTLNYNNLHSKRKLVDLEEIRPISQVLWEELLQKKPIQLVPAGKERERESLRTICWKIITKQKA